MKKNCIKCKKKIREKNLAWSGKASKSKKVIYWCVKCADKFHSQIKKKAPVPEKVYIDVDDAIYNLKVKMQKRYKLSWAKARDYVNNALISMLDPRWAKEDWKCAICGKTFENVRKLVQGVPVWSSVTCGSKKCEMEINKRIRDGK